MTAARYAEPLSIRGAPMTDAREAAAVRVLAEALEDACLELLGRDLGTVHRDEIAARGLAAVAPLIRAEVLRDAETLLDRRGARYFAAQGEEAPASRLMQRLAPIDTAPAAPGPLTRREE